MTRDPSPPACPKCGHEMQDGYSNATGLIGASEGKPRLTFVVPGTKTSINPLGAFKQGLRDEPDEMVYLIIGTRCRECGYLELYAS